MLTALAVAVLAASPASPTARITHARLSSSDAPIILVSDDAHPPGAIETMTREQLEHEYVQLNDNKPGLVAPLVVGGAGLVLFGAGLEVLVLQLNETNASLLIPAACMIVGGIAVAVGLVLLIIRMRERHAVDHRMEAINKRLDAMPEGTTKPGEFVPPPPPSTLYYPAPPVLIVEVASF